MPKLLKSQTSDANEIDFLSIQFKKFLIYLLELQLRTYLKKQKRCEKKMSRKLIAAIEISRVLRIFLLATSYFLTYRERYVTKGK